MATGRDLVLISIAIFILGIASISVYSIFNTAVDQMLNVSTVNSSNKTVSALEGAQEATNRMDYVIFMTFMGLCLAMIVVGWIVGSHPIFMFVYSMVMIISVILSAVFANVWASVSQASVFNNAISAFPITNNLLINFPIYMAVVGFIGLIVMFAKPMIFPND